VEASARLLSSSHLPCVLVERLRTRRVVCRVDDVHDFRCDPAHHELEPVLQGHLRRSAPLTSAAHCDEELAVANIDDRDLSTVASDGTIDFPVEQALNDHTNLG